MCYMHPMIWAECLHETRRRRRCSLWPDCRTRVLPAEHTQYAGGFCPDCRNRLGLSRTNNPMNSQPYVPQYQEAFGGMGAALGNNAQNGQIPQNGYVAQNGQQADVAAPQAPRAPSPNNPDPHLAVIRMHRDRLTEIENGFQIMLAVIQSPAHNNVQPGQGNQLDNLVGLITNLHVEVANLNRQYLRQVNEVIEILEAIGDHPNEREPPADRAIPAVRHDPDPFDYEIGFDVAGVPDLPNDEDDEDVGLINGHRNGNAYGLANGGIQPPDRAPSPQMNGHHGPMRPISLLSLQDDQRQCTICMQDIGSHESEDQHPVRLPCNHIFGNQCITRWLVEHGTCPICRRNYADEIGIE